MTKRKTDSTWKVLVRRARCKRVQVVLNNQLETVDFIREEIHPPVGDFDAGPLELAVVRVRDFAFEVYVPLETVVFLLIPKIKKGAVGLKKLLAGCPYPISPPKRNRGARLARAAQRRARRPVARWPSETRRVDGGRRPRG
jgi:hypothetical protein